MSKILVTGGAGYIGSHMVWTLLKSDYEVVVLDNFSTSDRTNIEAVEKLLVKKITVVEHDLTKPIDSLKFPKIDAVIHFAALKAVGESVEFPLKYYQNNVAGTINLLKFMQSQNINKLIFSSTAAVYSPDATMPLTEESPVDPQSPYGKSKLMVEEIIKDTARSGDLKATILRYFNVVGNIATAEFGEPRTAVANLVPAILSSHFGFRKQQLEVFGTDYDTPDGSAIRDYIHVLDLTRAHLAALQKLDTQNKVETFNLGTGTGISVMEIIKGFEEVAKVKVDYKVSPRRPGDLAICYASTSKALENLGFKPEQTLDDIIASAYKWWGK